MRIRTYGEETLEEDADDRYPPTRRVSISRMHDPEGADLRYIELTAKGFEDCGSTRWWYELAAPEGVDIFPGENKDTEAS